MLTLSSINSCAFCTHLREKRKDGWIVCCDFFPDWIPNDLLMERIDVTTLKECANAIKYFPDVEKQQMILNMK